MHADPALHDLSSSSSSSIPLPPSPSIQWAVCDDAETQLLFTDSTTAAAMQLDAIGSEQTDHEVSISKEQHDLLLLSSSLVTPLAAPPPSSPSPPSPPLPPPSGSPSPALTRTASLLDAFELDEVALRELDAIFTRLQNPLSSPVPRIPDIESLPLPPIPLDRYPQRILAVTALSSQLWCEEQTHLSLTLGRRVSPSAQLAMDRGSARHEELEREIHDVVHVEVATREEEWGLRLLNGVAGLHELMLVGKTRELLVMARLQRRAGEQPLWLMGVIDEVERIDLGVMEQRRLLAEAEQAEERRRAEERREKRREKEEAERLRAEALQRREEERKRAQSIRRHFPTPGGPGGAAAVVKDAGPEDEDMLELLRSFEAMQEEDERRRAAEQAEMEAKGREEKRLRLAERAREARRQNRARMQLPQETSAFVISDNKTRAGRGLPSIAQQRTTRMQLSAYKWMFDTLATAEAPLPPVTPSDLSGRWTADELMGAMGLREEVVFTSAFLGHLAASGFPASTTLRELVGMYLHTFASLALPSSEYLCVHYEAQVDASSMGSSLFAFDALTFQLDLQWLLRYWMGDRDSEGVLSGEHWKCQRCEYVVECSKTRWEGRPAKVRERKEEERRAKEAAEREKARKEEDEEGRRRQREQQRRGEAAGRSEAELTADEEAVDEAVMRLVKAESEEVKEGGAAAKVRRGRKRRSVQELTMSQDSPQKDTTAVVKKEQAEVVYIDLDP